MKGEKMWNIENRRSGPRGSRRATCLNAAGGLCRSRGQVDSIFVILGESPGVHELRTGCPFSSNEEGSAGVFLRDAMAANGIDDIFTECFVMNAINCDVNNYEDNDFWTESRKVVPGVACKDRVREEIFSEERMLILVFGNVPLRVLKRDTSLSVVDQPLWYQIRCPVRGNTIRVAHTYHPSSLEDQEECRDHIRQAVDYYRRIR